jgi:hypothetical protein
MAVSWIAETFSGSYLFWVSYLRQQPLFQVTDAFAHSVDLGRQRQRGESSQANYASSIPRLPLWVSNNDCLIWNTLKDQNGCAP